MNYRHHFHAGNFADVMKHALLVQLVRALQAKEKGFLYLDTHAGRGRYDLARAGLGDTLARRPEHPDGIGRLWARDDLPAALADYVGVVRAWDRATGNLEAQPRFYPGSPRLVQEIVRLQDRAMLIERHPDEAAALAREFEGERRVTVQVMDGYTAVRACLPPPERRALVLIDPPFEAEDEFARITEALQEGLRRLPGGTFAVWYPLTVRAGAEEFLRGLGRLALPPAWTAELAVAGPAAGLKMRGCGVLVVNPPWQLDVAVRAWLPWLGEVLAQAPGAAGALRWIVEER